MSEPDDPELRALHRMLLHAEGGLEPRVARLWSRLGLDRPRTLVPYRSFAHPGGLEVRGRLLASDAPRPTADDDRWWHHVGQSYQRWNTREVPGAEVRVRRGDDEVVVTTDEEGDYEAGLPAVDAGPGLRWEAVTASVDAGDARVEATHRVLLPGTDAQVLLLSDVDDTVLHTGATHALRMAWHSLAKSARRRLPLPGAVALYQALVMGPEGGVPRNPLAFVSSSPRNLYDVLTDFLALQGMPEAPVLLRDVGLDDTKIVKTRGHGHKLARIEEVMARYPHLPVVLLGDSGQHDPQLYAQAVERHGDRVRAVYIRDVDPHRDTARDAVADEHGAAIAARGVDYVRGGSEAFAAHARAIGLLAADQEASVAEAVAAEDR